MTGQSNEPGGPKKGNNTLSRRRLFAWGGAIVAGVAVEALTGCAPTPPEKGGSTTGADNGGNNGDTNTPPARSWEEMIAKWEEEDRLQRPDFGPIKAADHEVAFSTDFVDSDEREAAVEELSKEIFGHLEDYVNSGLPKGITVEELEEMTRNPHGMENGINTTVNATDKEWLEVLGNTEEFGFPESLGDKGITLVDLSDLRNFVAIASARNILEGKEPVKIGFTTRSENLLEDAADTELMMLHVDIENNRTAEYEGIGKDGYADWIQTVNNDEVYLNLSLKGSDDNNDDKLVSFDHEFYYFVAANFVPNPKKQAQ